MNFFALSLYLLRESLILILILNPVPLFKMCSTIAKYFGLEKVTGKHFTALNYFFGDADAAYELSELNLTKNDYKRYYTYLMKSAQMGNTKAQKNVFNINKAEGNTVADSISLALIGRHNTDAMIYLGERMLLKKQYKYANELFMSALNQGNSMACGHLGLICYKGLLQNKNKEMAMYYWEKGIEFHDPLSEYLFASAQLVKDSNKYSSEYRQAIYYLVCSASHGFYLGQLKLSKIMKEAIENSQKTGILTISKALKCHSSMVHGHFDHLFHMKNDFEEACY